MLNFRRIRLTASVLALAALLGSSLATTAVAQDKKKEGPKAGAPLLSKNEELTENDEKDTHQFLMNSPRKVYKLKLTEGKSYQIDLKSKDFDAVLRLEDPSGKELAFNDDFEPGRSLDARIVYSVTKSGEYRIIATCLDAKPGKFSLTVVEGKGGSGPAVGGPAASMFKGKTIDLTFKDGKASYSGELTNNDPVAQQHFYKVFSIKLEEGKTYRIEHSDAGDDPKFDAYLFLEDADGKKLAEDDDSGGGLNSRIVYKAAKSATYRIIATTLPPRQTGKFKLTVAPGDANDEKEARLLDLISNYAKYTKVEQKKIVAEAVKRFQGKAADLTISDARLAFQLANATEDGDIEVSRSAYKALVQAFSEAGNPQVAGVAKSFEASLKKLDMIGKAIEITGKTVEGKDFDLKNLKGKVVLVDFWATWCGPCIAEMPNIEKAYEKYHGKGFDVIGISLDRTDDAITKFAEARKMKWTSINIEDSRALADRYGVNAIPFPVLVDQAGNVVSLRARGPQLEMLLERLLGERNK